MHDDRRVRIININPADASKYKLLALLRKLPEDAKMYQADKYVGANGVTYLGIIFESEEFELIDAGQRIPTHNVYLSLEDVNSERNGKSGVSSTAPTSPPPGGCICDFAYTGLRAHKYECPQGQRRRQQQ